MLRVRRGEAVEDVAASVGRSVRELLRAVDELTDPKDVAVFLKSLAAEFDYTAQTEFGFDFVDVPGKRYRPDCVWFEGGASPANVVAIFEIDKDVSPKHLAGGVIWANIVALATSKTIHLFVVTPEKSIGVPTKTLQLFRKYLADRWHLVATPIAGFSPDILKRAIAPMMSRGVDLPRKTHTEETGPVG